jgi:hypothetical protein
VPWTTSGTDAAIEAGSAAECPEASWPRSSRRARESGNRRLSRRPRSTHLRAASTGTAPLLARMESGSPRPLSGPASSRRWVDRSDGRAPSVRLPKAPHRWSRTGLKLVCGSAVAVRVSISTPWVRVASHVLEDAPRDALWQEQ